MRQEPDIDKALSDLFREPWYKRLWSWLTGPSDPSDQRPLTDSEFREATEQLDRVLRLPWYKRTPALILWLWRLP